MASSRPWNRVLSLAVTLVVLFGILKDSLVPSSDPHRCSALMSRGTWRDPLDSEGLRQSLKHWEPDGCMLHKYSANDIRDCVEGRHLLFIGDSTTRQVYWATARQLDENKANELEAASKAHEDYDAEFDGVRLVFHWNPYLKLDKEHDITVTELQRYYKQRTNPRPVQDQENAAAILIGTGAWFAANLEASVALRNFSQAYSDLRGIVHHSDFPSAISQPFDETDGMGPQIFVAPPVPPIYGDDNSRVKDGKGVASESVVALQNWLEEYDLENNLPLLRAFPLLTNNEPEAIDDLQNTGFHVIKSVADIKANIILNARCNAKLDRMHGYPYDRTCCTDYSILPPLQILLLGLCVGYLALCVLNEIRLLGDADHARSGLFNLDLGIFVTALLACYWADRTQAFAKGSKAFESWEFSALCLLAAAVCVATMAKTAPPRPKPGQQDADVSLADTKPLSRDQTDEWKGWMQAIILIYHWTGGSRVLGIYIGVRLLVAAYLFQTGFGHAVYFVSKKDFSFKRVASVLLRLNLLSCALPFVMHTEYMFYYFAPLVSFWFLIVYATFAVGSQYNDNPRALMAKFGVAATICPGLVLWTPLLDWVFAVLGAVFRIEWDLREWQFRLGLDGFIVYIGVFMGIASVQTKVYNQLLTQSKGIVGLLGAGAMLVYWWASSTYLGEKKLYNQFHPFISFIPILGFIALRNINATARLWFSRGMAWLGRCSLETFTLQFHLFLAADTKGLLLTGLFSGNGSLFQDRWRDFFLIAALFLWLSWRVAEATNAMVKLLITVNAAEKPALAGELDVESKGDAEKMAEPRWWQKLHCADLRLRVGGMLLAMWLMNLLY
ncbi:hypothetical protein NLU13_8750 [Sarocladium strictum]|uniref:Cas1p 10 TM acyl transferase domain-containing protein n=1 Tax=Sarocladium strictum TaxID=5046 RepID=A0AA39L5J1_SARSR|nr:hypothetical protein NLU13_8750 [Sarocladium strictum]